MITGVTTMTTQITEKYLELLLAAVSGLRRIGILLDSTSPNHAKFMDSARRSIARHAVEGRFAEVAKPEEIEPAVSRLATEGAQALILMPSNFFPTYRQRIVQLALAKRWAVIGGALEWAEDGALLAYGADLAALYRRSAWYVDRILKGAKPGDLPIEQPTKFELLVNMKTAKALGLTIPQPFLMRADRVIE
jgi:putative ABC transport system substrate-binding protein